MSEFIEYLAIPDATPVWWFFAAIGLAVIILGVAKSGFGGGVGILAVPLMANAMPPQRALGVMLPILIFADLFAVSQHRKHVSKHHLKWALTGAVGGIAVGTAMLLWFQSRGGQQTQEQLALGLKLVVGLMCLLLVGVQCYRMLGGKFPKVPDKPGAGLTAGGIAGVASMLAHAAGPIMSIYMLEHRLEKRKLVGTLAVFFFVVNWMKVPSYVWLGWISGWSLAQSAIFATVVPIGSLIGIWMHHRIPEKPFVIVMYLGAAAAGAKLVYDAALATM